MDEKESSAASFRFCKRSGTLVADAARRSREAKQASVLISAVIALGQNRGELLVRLQAVRRQPLGIVELRLVFVA